MGDGDPFFIPDGGEDLPDWMRYEDSTGGKVYAMFDELPEGSAEIIEKFSRVGLMEPLYLFNYAVGLVDELDRVDPTRIGDVPIMVAQEELEKAAKAYSIMATYDAFPVLGVRRETVDADVEVWALKQSPEGGEEARQTAAELMQTLFNVLSDYAADPKAHREVMEGARGFNDQMMSVYSPLGSLGLSGVSERSEPIMEHPDLPELGEGLLLGFEDSTDGLAKEILEGMPAGSSELIARMTYQGIKSPDEVVIKAVFDVGEYDTEDPSRTDDEARQKIEQLLDDYQRFISLTIDLPTLPAFGYRVDDSGEPAFAWTAVPKPVASDRIRIALDYITNREFEMLRGFVGDPDEHRDDFTESLNAAADLTIARLGISVVLL